MGDFREPVWKVNAQKGACFAPTPLKKGLWLRLVLTWGLFRGCHFLSLLNLENCELSLSQMCIYSLIWIAQTLLSVYSPVVSAPVYYPSLVGLHFTGTLAGSAMYAI